MPKIKIVCSKCGGDTILRDAYAYWDVEAQEWTLSSVYDSFLCSSCGHDACDEVPIDDEPETPEQLARAEGWLPDESSPTPGTVYKRDHGETHTASDWKDACRLEGIELQPATEILATVDPDMLEAVADEIDCFEHSARAASLRGLAKRQRSAIAKATSNAT